MTALERHPDPWVEERLRILRAQGWKVVRNKNGNFYDITCRAATGTRMNIRIYGKLGRGSGGKTARQQLADFLIRHERGHPGE